MTQTTLSGIHRGDQIATPKGTVTVTSFTTNWAEDFGRKQGVTTVTVVGTMNGKGVRLTAPASTPVEVSR